MLEVWTNASQKVLHYLSLHTITLSYLFLSLEIKYRDQINYIKFFTIWRFLFQCIPSVKSFNFKIIKALNNTIRFTTTPPGGHIPELLSEITSFLKLNAFAQHLIATCYLGSIDVKYISGYQLRFPLNYGPQFQWITVTNRIINYRCEHYGVNILGRHVPTNARSLLKV